MIRVQREDFDPAREAQALVEGKHQIGGVVSLRRPGARARFRRCHQRDDAEHYSGMTERKLAEIEADAHARWPLAASLIIHRYGRLEPGERIVLVATASSAPRRRLRGLPLPRRLAQDQGAHFWKLEETPQGERWVKARAEDDRTAQGWTKPKSKPEAAE